MREDSRKAGENLELNQKRSFSTQPTMTEPSSNTPAKLAADFDCGKKRRREALKEE
jgi:hypothetical protein